MKYYYKKYVLHCIILLGMSICIMNCERESEVIFLNEKISNSEFKVSQIEYAEIIKNPVIVDKLMQINSNQRIIKNRNAEKSVYSDAHNFTIDTDYASYIESDGGLYHSFTFPLIQETQDESLENLVLSQQADGSYKLLLVIYTLANGEVDLNADIEILEIEDDSMIDEIFEKTRTNCIWVLSEWCSYGNLDHPGGYIAEGQKCPGYSNATSQECISGTGSDDTGTGGSGSDTSDPDQGGSGGSNGTDPKPDVTVPTIKPNDTLNCEGVSDEIKEELIHVFGAGNFVKNCDLDINDPDIPSFNTLEELQAFAESAFNSSSENSSGTADSQNQSIAEFRFNDWIFSYNVNVKQQLGTDHEFFIDYDVLDVTSNISGITLFVSYEQENWAYESLNANVSTVIVGGQATVSIVYKGFGQFIQKNFKFRLKMDAIDGSPISGVMEEL